MPGKRDVIISDLCEFYGQCHSVNEYLLNGYRAEWHELYSSIPLKMLIYDNEVAPWVKKINNLFNRRTQKYASRTKGKGNK